MQLSGYGGPRGSNDYANNGVLEDIWLVACRPGPCIIDGHRCPSLLLAAIRESLGDRVDISAVLRGKGSRRSRRPPGLRLFRSFVRDEAIV
jgi:hypothetical protein